MTLIQIGEILILPVILILFEAWRDKRMKKQELQGEVAVKETVDKTDFTRILVDQNNTRYDTVLVELREARDKLDAAIEQLTSQKMENLHLRHLLGLGPEDDLPSTRKEMLLRSQDPSDPLNLSPTNGEA